MRRRVLVEFYPVFLFALLLQFCAPVLSAQMRAASPAGVVDFCMPSSSSTASMVAEDGEAPRAGAMAACELCQFAATPNLPLPEIVSFVRAHAQRVAQLVWLATPQVAEPFTLDPNIRSRAPPALS